MKQENTEKQNKLDFDSETLRQQQQQFHSRVAEVNRKEEYARSCYKQAEAAAIRAKEIRETASNKISNMEQQVKKLQEQLGSARQNIKRRKRQLQELKE